MPDYRHDLLFGVQLEPTAPQAHDVVALAALSESAGLDLISLADHPYRADWLDALTVLATIAARTSKVRMFFNLANLPLRPPAMPARAAATLDILSDGRFELGIGTGGRLLWDSIVAEGGPRRSAGESVEALQEAVQLMRALWVPGAPVHFDGKHYQLRGATAGPAPAHPINIWLGAYQPRMLRVVGALADGWVVSSPFLPPEGLAAACEIIDRAANEADRAPESIRRIYNVEGEFGHPSGFLQGPAELWIEQLTDLALAQGISAFMLWRADAAAIRRFAQEVAPAVREAVTKERAIIAQTATSAG